MKYIKTFEQFVNESYVPEDYLGESMMLAEKLSYDETKTAKIPVNLTVTAIQTSIGQHLFEFQITKVLTSSQFKKEQRLGNSGSEEYRKWFPVQYGCNVSSTASGDKYAPAWNKESKFTLKFKPTMDKYSIPLAGKTRTNTYFASDYEESIPFEDWKKLMSDNGFKTKKKGNKWISTRDFKNDKEALAWLKTPLK